MDDSTVTQISWIYHTLNDRGVETAIGTFITWFIDKFNLVDMLTGGGGVFSGGIVLWLLNEKFGFIGKAKHVKKNGKGN